MSQAFTHERLIIILSVVLIFAPSASANLLFFDDFNAGARPEWGNEWGDWVAENGVYDASFKGGVPPTYSSVTSLSDLTDFWVELDINDISDGGVMLRSSDKGNGVLLVTGGSYAKYEGLYWHIVENDHPRSRLNYTPFPGIIGMDGHIKIEVLGDTYKAFLNGNPDPLTTLVTDKYSSGKVGLYDYSEQTFDNVAIYDYNEHVIPEPASLLLLGIGLCGVFGLNRRPCYLLTAALLFTGVSAARGETVLLKSGREIVAPVIEEADSFIKVSVDGVPVTLHRNESNP